MKTPPLTSLLTGMDFRVFASGAGYASFKMTEACGNTRDVQRNNTVAALNQFVNWVEVNDLTFAEAAYAVRAEYATLPGGES